MSMCLSFKRRCGSISRRGYSCLGKFGVLEEVNVG